MGEDGGEDKDEEEEEEEDDDDDGDYYYDYDYLQLWPTSVVDQQRAKRRRD